jgi:hypothetical protein
MTPFLLWCRDAVAERVSGERSPLPHRVGPRFLRLEQMHCPGAADIFPFGLNAGDRP